MTDQRGSASGADCVVQEVRRPCVALKCSRHVDAKWETKVQGIVEGGEGRSSSSESNHRVPHFFRGPTSAVGDASAKAKCPSPREEQMNDNCKQPSEQQQHRTESPRNHSEQSHPFTPGQFHVLLNTLSKVLFNFTSRSLSTIRLIPVFSLGWTLPPDLGCIPSNLTLGSKAVTRCLH